MKAIYRLNEREVKEQLKNIEKYSQWLEKELSYSTELINQKNVKSYEETIANAKHLITGGIIIENDFRIKSLLSRGVKLEIIE